MLEFTERAVLDSAGCMSQFTSCVAARLMLEGAYEANVEYLRGHYALRRDALVEGLRESLPDGCAFHRPGGGLFLLVTLPPGLTAGDLVDAGVANGVGFFEGTRFAISPTTAASAWASACTRRTKPREGAARLGPDHP